MERRHIIAEGFFKGRKRLESYLDGVLETLERAETVTEGLTPEEGGQTDAQKEWLDEPAMAEQSCAFHRPFTADGIGKALNPASQEGLMYRADGRPYLRLRFANAIEVQIQIGSVRYPFLEVDKDLWIAELPVEPGFYYVHLYVDNCLVLSPYLPIGYGHCRPANYIEVGPMEEFCRLRWVEHGTVRHEYFFSSVTGRMESCLCYTPPGYDGGRESYPVLYLQHGFGENERGWIWQGKVNHILDNLLAEGKAVPMLIVMADGMATQEREDGSVCLEPRLFARQLMEDIIPFIEESFRVKKGREYRAVAGLSMGSMQASVVVGEHLECFAWAGIFSGFLHDLKEEAPDNSHLETMKRPDFNEKMRLLFRAMGRQDEFWERFAADDVFCSENQIECVRREYEGGHDWNVWRKCARDFLPLLFV